MTREITHMKAFALALESMGKPAFSLGRIAPTPGLVDQFFNDSTGTGEHGEIDIRGPWNEGNGWVFTESPAIQAEPGASAILTESSPQAGSAERLSSRFARVHVRVGYNKLIPEKPSPEWLLIEWPEGEAEPTKYWLSTLPETISFERLVDLAQAALAHRARLSGAEARGRARSLRGPRLARLPSPRNSVHRGLWFPDRRASDDSPLRAEG